MRERMMRWNDATTIDESERQNKLVDAEIAEAQRSPRRSVAIIVLAMGSAITSEAWLDSTPLALAFVAAPVLAYATSAITRVFSKSSRSQSDKPEK